MSCLLDDGYNTADTAAFGYKGERWNFVEGEALTGIVSKLNKEQSRYVINASTCRVVWRTLLFYPGATLVRVIDMNWRPHGLPLYFLGLKGQYRRIDGSRKFIHFLNEHVPLKLTPALAPDYLRFYCFFVRQDSRPFLIVEQPEDLGLFETPLPSDSQQHILSRLHPIQSTQASPEAPIELKAVVRHNDVVCECTFSLTQQGHLRMTDEEPIYTHHSHSTNPFSLQDRHDRH